jgi:hypothetical protein
MSVREKGLWAQALKALDDARLSGEIRLRAGVRIDVGCCDEMLHDAVAAGSRYTEDQVLAYTAAVATELALQPQSEAHRVVWRAPGEPPAPIIQSKRRPIA